MPARGFRQLVPEYPAGGSPTEGAEPRDRSRCHPHPRRLPAPVPGIIATIGWILLVIGLVLLVLGQMVARRRPPLLVLTPSTSQMGPKAKRK